MMMNQFKNILIIQGLIFFIHLSLSYSFHVSCYTNHRGFQSHIVTNPDKLAKSFRQSPFASYAKTGDEDELGVNESVSSKSDMGGAGNGFDEEGFANYLAPYAATFVLSLVATAAFFQFLQSSY